MTHAPSRASRPLRLAPLLLALATAATAVATAGCGPLVLTPEVTSATTVPGNPNPLAPLLDVMPGLDAFTGLSFDLEQELRNEGVRREQVDSVKVTGVTLRVLTPEGQTLDFLDALSIFARVGDREVLVASRDPISGVGRELALTATGAELKDFITAPSMQLVVRGKGKQPPQDTRLEARVQLRVGVKLGL
jgi:hypothetical protein